MPHNFLLNCGKSINIREFFSMQCSEIVLSTRAPVVARLPVHIRHGIPSPPRRTNRHIIPFVMHIPSTHSSISDFWDPRPHLLSMKPTLFCQGTIGSIFPSTQSIMVPSAPKACIPHDGSRWKLKSPSHDHRCET